MPFAPRLPGDAAAAPPPRSRGCSCSQPAAAGVDRARPCARSSSPGTVPRGASRGGGNTHEVWRSYTLRNWMLLFLSPFKLLWGLIFTGKNYNFSFEPKYPQYRCPASCRKPRVVGGDRCAPGPPLPQPQPAPPACSQPCGRGRLSSPKMTPVVTQIRKCLLPML